MKKLAIFLISVAMQGADYYVANASGGGNDSNPGTQAAPWLTLQHAVNSVSCGDTINIVANGAFVAGDANLPAFDNCTSVTTIQSSALANFALIGYRTNPANDSANYGKLSFTNQGISAAPGVWTFNAYFSYSAVSFNTSTSVVTITNGNGLTYPNLANGSQVELEVSSEGASYGSVTYPSIAMPGGIIPLRHYYVVNCGVGSVGSAGYPQQCGQPNSSFQLALNPGGSPIMFSGCRAGSYCASTVTIDPTGGCAIGSIQYNTTDSTTWGCPSGNWTPSFNFINVGVTTAVNTSTNTITIPNNGGNGSLANGMGITFSAAGFQSFGTLPSPLQLDTIYYVENLSGKTFQVALTPGGAPVALTSTGTGMISTASSAIASNWAFRGLEMAPNGTSAPYTFFNFGNGSETSIYGMASRMEVDRCYLHDNPPSRGIAHAIYDNSTNLNVHDSWIIGADLGEAQAIGGTASPGPTTIKNNFLEASGEVTLYGGSWSPYSPANSKKTFTGNYFYKPPVWKVSSSTTTPSGACLYDATDPTHAGGEWYTNTSTGINYQCTSSFTWATTAFTPPPLYTLKDMTEHKNGSYFTYVGNIYNYSFTGAQSGEAWNDSMEYGSGPGAANDHITIMNNAVYNVFQFMTRTSQCGNTTNAVCPIYPGNHVTTNNLVVINSLACGVGFDTNTCGDRLQALQSTPGGMNPYFSGDTWNHNTIWTADSYPFAASLTPMYASSPTGACGPFTPIPYTTNFFNSIMPGDFLGDCTSAGALLLAYYTNSNFAANVLKGATGSYSSVGATNNWSGAAFPATNASIGYVNGTGTITGDYHLAPTSPYSAQNANATQLGTDQTDLGADIDMVEMATSGVLAGTPPWDVQAGLQVNPGSSQVVFNYTAPTSDPCTATIYNLPARIPANQVASASDNSANSVSDASRRELLVTGLPALPTQQSDYYYKLACGGGVLMVGSFAKRESGRAILEVAYSWSSPTAMEYSSSSDMSGAVSLPPAKQQVIPVAANSVVYVRQGTAGPVTILIAP